MSLGSNIKRLRRDQGLTQAQLGKMTNIKVGHISRLESDNADSKLSTIYKLMEAFECSADSLLMDKNRVGIDSILKSTLERALNLPEENKRIIIDVVDKYCIASGMQQAFSEQNKARIRIWTEGPEGALPDNNEELNQ